MKVNNCQQCGQEFEATRSDRKYCSDSCKQQAYISRQSNDSINGMEESTPKVNPAVFPFLKDYLEGLLSDDRADCSLSDSQIGLQRIRVSQGGNFLIQSMLSKDIESINNSLMGGNAKITKGKTRVVDVVKELHWDISNDDDPPKRQFTTYKIMIPYDLVREQLNEYNDEDLILE
jgi:hypothetical protein